MNQLLFTLLRLDAGDDIREKWHNKMLEDSLNDVRSFAIIITMLLCVLALAVVMLVVAKILEKKNDYGDEDEMHMRRSKASSASINARVYSDIASGSINCMKNFKYEDVSRY
jgi:hypothetical protein